MGMKDRVKEILDEEAKYSKYKSQKKHPTLNYILTGERAEHNAEYEARMEREAEAARIRREKAKSIVGKAAKKGGELIKGLAEEAKEFGEGVGEGVSEKPVPRRNKVHVFSKEVDEDFFQEGYA